jgi:hypothetical protein
MDQASDVAPLVCAAIESVLGSDFTETSDDVYGGTVVEPIESQFVDKLLNAQRNADLALRLEVLDGRGRALIASRAIAAGDVILSELPILEFVGSATGSSSQQRFTVQGGRPALLAALPTALQRAPHCLKPGSRAGMPVTAAAITEVVTHNAFATHGSADNSTGKQRLCLYALMSLFNHSCAPNADVLHATSSAGDGGGGLSERGGTTFVVANRTIAAGEVSP